MTYRALPAFCVGLLLLAGSFGCSSAPTRSASDERKLIEEAIDRHLAKRSDLDFSAMDVSVNRVNLIDDDKAEALVRFQAGEGEATAIQMNYSLARTDGAWEVVGVPSPGAQSGQAAPPSGAMPLDHPPTDGELPSGHPPVN